MDTPHGGPSGEAIDTPRHRALASGTRVAILQLVRREDRAMTAAEVAEFTGRHLSTVRDHLDQLAATGLLIRERRGDGTPGRPAWCYRAGTDPDPALSPFQELAAALVAHLSLSDDPWSAGLAAGRAWGRQLAVEPDAVQLARPGDRLVAVLDRLRFSPRVVTRQEGDPVEVHLHSCPFLDLVKSSPDVVCGLHLGVIRGVWGAAGFPAVGTRLEPFGAPAACVLRLPPPHAGAEEEAAADV